MNAHHLKIVKAIPEGETPAMACTSYGTKIYLDGNELTCTGFELSGAVDGVLSATFTIHVTGLDIDIPANVTINEND